VCGGVVAAAPPLLWSFVPPAPLLPRRILLRLLRGKREALYRSRSALDVCGDQKTANPDWDAVGGRGLWPSSSTWSTVGGQAEIWKRVRVVSRSMFHRGDMLAVRGELRLRSTKELVSDGARPGLRVWSFSYLSGDGGGGRWKEVAAHKRSFKGFFFAFFGRVFGVIVLGEVSLVSSREMPCVLYYKCLI
jgi:hypothetical protein